MKIGNFTAEITDKQDWAEKMKRYRRKEKHTGNDSLNSFNLNDFFYALLRMCAEWIENFMQL